MKTLITLLFCLFGVTAQAQKVYVTGGMRSDTADSDSTGVETSGKIGFQAGAILHYDVGGMKVRTGALYVTRNFQAKQGSTVVSEPRLSYIELPLGALFKVNDYASAFAGGYAAFNLGKENASGVNTFPLGIQLGGHFELTSKFGIELYYEMGFTKLADEVKTPRALVGQLLYSF